VVGERAAVQHLRRARTDETADEDMVDVAAGHPLEAARLAQVEVAPEDERARATPRVDRPVQVGLRPPRRVRGVEG
jgi:hypothetical protein